MTTEQTAAPAATFTPSLALSLALVDTAASVGLSEASRLTLAKLPIWAPLTATAHGLTLEQFYKLPTTTAVAAIGQTMLSVHAMPGAQMTTAMIDLVLALGELVRMLEAATATEPGAQAHA